jgi:hypothetical protein
MTACGFAGNDDIIYPSKVAAEQVSFPIIDGHPPALAHAPSTSHGEADGWPCVMGPYDKKEKLVFWRL